MLCQILSYVSSYGDVQVRVIFRKPAKVTTFKQTGNAKTKTAQSWSDFIKFLQTTGRFSTSYQLRIHRQDCSILNIRQFYTVQYRNSKLCMNSGISRGKSRLNIWQICFRNSISSDKTYRVSNFTATFTTDSILTFLCRPVYDIKGHTPGKGRTEY